MKRVIIWILSLCFFLPGMSMSSGVCEERGIAEKLCTAMQQYWDDGIDSAENNTQTLLAGLARQMVSIYPQYTVKMAEKTANQNDTYVEDTGYLVEEDAFSDFDAVLVCTRECATWETIEFYGLEKSMDAETYTVKYVEIQLGKISMMSGKMIDMMDVATLRSVCIERKEYASSNLFGILLEQMCNDAQAAKYLHYDAYEICVECVEENANEVKNETMEEPDPYDPIRQLLRLNIHVYAGEPISVEVLYRTDLNDGYTQEEIAKEIKELNKAILKRYPDLGRNFPYAHYMGFDSNDCCTVRGLIQFEDYEEEELWMK